MLGGCPLTLISSSVCVVMIDFFLPAVEQFSFISGKTHGTQENAMLVILVYHKQDTLRAWESSVRSSQCTTLLNTDVQTCGPHLGIEFLLRLPYMALFFFSFWPYS